MLLRFGQRGTLLVEDAAVEDEVVVVFVEVELVDARIEVLRVEILLEPELATAEDEVEDVDDEMRVEVLLDKTVDEDEEETEDPAATSLTALTAEFRVAVPRALLR